jgi:hypothetical protein
MFESLRRQWKQFKAGEPGRRFRERYRRRHEERQGRCDARRVANVCVGCALIGAGLVLVPAPGPGWLIVFFGGHVLGGEFLWIARALDRAELRGREWADRGARAWERTPPWGKALLLLAALSLAAGSTYAAYALLLKR